MTCYKLWLNTYIKIAYVVAGLALIIFGFYFFWAAWTLGYYERVLSADYFMYGIISNITGIVLLVRGVMIRSKEKEKYQVPKS